MTSKILERTPGVSSNNFFLAEISFRTYLLPSGESIALTHFTNILNRLRFLNLSLQPPIYVFSPPAPAPPCLFLSALLLPISCFIPAPNHSIAEAGGGGSS